MVTDTPRRDVWVTGLGLVSSIADGADEHWARLHGSLAPIIVKQGKTDCLVHPLSPLDFSSQIPNKLDLKRMGPLQASGVYAAGRALESAGLKAAAEFLSHSVVVVGGAGGERDIVLDETIFSEPMRFANPVELNQKVKARMRPSLFLSQLPNLLAGNISILFGVTGGSRTTMGEELAGFTACKIGYQLLVDGAYDIALVGGAFCAEREDLLLLYGFGGCLWPDNYQPVWARSDRDGGFILGSMAAFLVLETADHARARGVVPWCGVRGLSARHTRRDQGDVAKALKEAWDEIERFETSGPLGVITGATGISPATAEELTMLSGLSTRYGGTPIRASGSLFGHGLEASFPFNLALAALALRHGRLWPKFEGDDPGLSETGAISRMLVTGVGHWRGEFVGLLGAADA